MCVLWNLFILIVWLQDRDLKGGSFNMLTVGLTVHVLL